MLVYDQYGRQLIRYQIDDLLSVELLTVRFYQGDIYLKNETDGLWYKVICETVDSIIVIRMAQTNTVLTPP